MSKQLTLLEVLRTNCHTLSELSNFCASNSISVTNHDVVKRKAELFQEDLTSDNTVCEKLKLLFTTEHELDIAIESGLDTSHAAVKQLLFEYKVTYNYCF